MARYKPINRQQALMLPLSLEDQLVPGTFEYALDYLVEKEMDFSVFDSRYNNDETGAPAYDPRLLFKVVVYAYSQGITSSRKIDALCQKHILYKALSSGTEPHFTTIADFVSGSPEAIEKLFSQVLLICDEMGLIGGEMFAIDGCRLPSDASKEWSGTHQELEEKAEKMEKMARHLCQRHVCVDNQEGEEGVPGKADVKKVETLRQNARKIKEFLERNKEQGDKQSIKGNTVKSNITDNQSAKIKTSKGVIQGYNGIAGADEKHQVIIHAEVFGEASEKQTLKPMVAGMQSELESTGHSLQKACLLTDNGFHTTDNLAYLEEQHIDAYIPDNHFRKRDPRFQEQDKHKPQKRPRPFPYKNSVFAFNPEQQQCACPAGHPMHYKGTSMQNDRYTMMRFQAAPYHCRECHLRSECLRNPNQRSPRAVNFILEESGAKTDILQRMKDKIDSLTGRYIYDKRLGIIEPVFGHITSNLGLNRFSHRGKTKVNAQWKLFCMVHNLFKIQRYGNIG